MPEAINLRKKLSLINELWQPKVIAELNDYQLKLVKAEGEFVWHTHADTDEMFLCVKGNLTIETQGGDVQLGQGDLYVVPRGVRHRPIAGPGCEVLLIEPRGVINTGDADTDRTAESDQWI